VDDTGAHADMRYRMPRARIRDHTRAWVFADPPKEFPVP